MPSAESRVPALTLNNGVTIPQLGFGVFLIDRPDAVEKVGMALDAGFRHIDTAQAYGNEAEVGLAVERSGLKRSEVFITTKLDRRKLGHDLAISRLDESLERLRTDHVDLYLIHWPSTNTGLNLETWQAFETLLAQGKTRAIGVSNYSAGNLRFMAGRGMTVPAVNQVELHPNFQQADLRRYHDQHGIATEAWSPIARGRVLGDLTIAQLAGRYGKSPVQIILRWQMQIGNVVLIKSNTPARIRENIDIFDFSLSDADMQVMAGLDGDPKGAPSRTGEVGIAPWNP